jgi:hypothetical protein
MSLSDAALALQPSRSRWSTRATLVAIGATILTAIAAGTAFMVTTRMPVLDHRRIAVVSAGTPSAADLALDSVAERGNAAIRYALARSGLVTVVDEPPGRGRRAGMDHVDVRAIGRHSRAGSVVVTSARRDRDTVVYDAQILETLGSRVRWVVPPVRMTVVSPGPPLDQLAQRVAGAVAALGDPRFASWLPAAASPPTLAAYQELDRGMDLRLRNRMSESIAHFERAAALDTAFTWALLESALAHMTVGDRAGADSIVGVAETLRERLTPVGRHWLDWMIAVKEEDLTRSYSALERAARIGSRR